MPLDGVRFSYIRALIFLAIHRQPLIFDDHFRMRTIEQTQKFVKKYNNVFLG